MNLVPKFLRRKTIKERMEDDLYAAHLHLADCEAKHDHAMTVAKHHEVNVETARRRIQRFEVRLGITEQTNIRPITDRKVF